MRYKFSFICTIAIVFCYCSSPSKNSQKDFKYEADGFVPDSATAVKVALAILPKIYGENVLKEKPFSVSLIGDSVWIVEGSLPKGMLGGVAHIEIRKSDCKVLKVIHGK